MAKAAKSRRKPAARKGAGKASGTPKASGTGKGGKALPARPSRPSRKREGEEEEPTPPKAKATTKGKAKPKATTTKPKSSPKKPAAKASPKQSAKLKGKDAYERHRERAAERQRTQTRSGQDIGELPKVKNRKRRERCAKALRLFLETYCAERFGLAWSDDHLRVIAKIEQAVLRGGLFALAMPRGSGKTTLIECAVLWAILYGYRRFVVLIGADKEAAIELLDSIKVELETNDLLLADFPEACHPIRCLDGIANRCKGQRHNGQRTRISWKGSTLVMPTIKGSSSSGAIIRVAGITGRIRGMKHATPDGKQLRPDFVIPDDPQTDESAHSIEQCKRRVKVLSGAVLGLAGPSKKIAGVMPCTVIVRDDVADQLLDRKKHPEWQGERTQMVYEWPSSDAAQKHLDRYAEIRAEELAHDRPLDKATAYWRKHRRTIERGSRVAWAARYNDDECSALQHAYNLWLTDPDTFASEYQNDPIDEAEDTELLSTDEIAAKQHGYSRGEVPAECSKLTAFIDVQGALLYYVVTAWTDDFTGYVLDYGSWPDQQTRHFTLASARKTLAMRYRGRGLEGRLFAGLTDLIGDGSREGATGSASAPTRATTTSPSRAREGREARAGRASVVGLLDRTWRRDDGAELSIERLMIDANWGDSTDVVYQVCRESPHRALLLPSHGRGVGAGQKPINEWQKKPGEQAGLNWRIRPTVRRQAVRHALYDTNFWKSFVHARLSVGQGDRGCLSFWRAKVKTQHRMIAEHCRAEARTTKVATGQGREVDEWSEKPGRPDNHLFDCLVGSAVLASIQGCSLPEHGRLTGKKKTKLSDLQRQKRKAR